MLTDNDRSFFAPLWRRVAVIVFCFGWAIWEWSRGEDMWAMLVAAIGAYGIWVFIIRFDDEAAKRLAKAKQDAKDPDASGKSD
jgi:hypothetical protein